MAKKPAKGKAKVKVTASGKKVSYGQAGKAKGGGPRVKPGTSKGDSYCARSLGIKKGLSKKKQNDPNTPNNLSRSGGNVPALNPRRNRRILCQQVKVHTVIRSEDRQRRKPPRRVARKKCANNCKMLYMTAEL